MLVHNGQNSHTGTPSQTSNAQRSCDCSVSSMIAVLTAATLILTTGCYQGAKIKTTTPYTPSLDGYRRLNEDVAYAKALGLLKTVVEGGGREAMEGNEVTEDGVKFFVGVVYGLFCRVQWTNVSGVSLGEDKLGAVYVAISLHQPVKGRRVQYLGIKRAMAAMRPGRTNRQVCMDVADAIAYVAYYKQRPHRGGP